MPRIIHRFSAVKVASLMVPGLHPDGSGLYLRITRTGTKSWIYRYSYHGRSHDMGLGAIGTVSLSRARQLGAEFRRLLSEGHDPLRVRGAERMRQRMATACTASFKECAEELIAAHEVGWRNPKHRQQWRNTLCTYAYPLLGDLPVAEIDTDTVLNVLQQQVTVRPGKTENFWKARPETASRVRGRVEAVLSWAKAKGLRQGENPAQWRGHLDQLLPAPGKVRRVRHHPALPFIEIPAFMARLRQNASIRARALEFLILTASRTVEALGARFEEFDLQRELWTVPASRMKGHQQHRVPLCMRAAEIVKEMAELRLNDFVFPGMKAGRPLSDMALLTLLRELHPGITTHGFRSTFKDWANEKTTFPDFLSEAALAHVSADKVRVAYARSDLFQQRRALMAAWAAWSAHEPTEVAWLPNAGLAL